MPVLRFATGQAFYNDTLKKHFDFSKCFLYVGEKIRTPDLLVRSQTLYPAELRPHSLQITFTAKFIISHIFINVNTKYKKILHSRFLLTIS